MLDAVWLIPALPLAGFLILLATGRRLGDPRAGYVATAAIFGAFLVSLLVFLDLIGEHHDHRAFTKTLFTWVPAGGLEVNVGFLVDPLSITMAMFVTGVGSLIHLYSIGYMHGDPRYPTFFVYLNLFAFSMLMLVLGDNFLITFLGWEGVGACSYFLISFWFERNSAATAGPKAFITNRVGDFGFMLAMFLIFTATGSLTYTTVFAEAETLTRTTATAISLLLFVGACGKSAQLPLYVWLPDAMEGPTPVSALIHAATMVTAGVFLMCRVNPILDLAPTALTVVAVVGAVTALFAATIACAQNDIKKVLAYSTISQLGYMFLAVGSGAYVAAIFHMVTHAFFKALLFLGAGSVIHGLHDEQDMTRMGNLKKWMPVTYATFIVGWLSIAGVPPFSGFWSKDEILAFAWDKSPILWAVGLFTALLTAYYMSRQVFLVFFGDDRWKHAAPAAAAHGPSAAAAHAPSAAAAHAPSAAAAHDATHDATHDAGHGGAHGHGDPHESPPTMKIPLIVLAAASVLGGLLNLPFAGYELEHFLEPVFGERLHHLSLASSAKLVLALIAIACSLAGIGIASLIYLKRRIKPVEPEILRHAWYVDDLYAQVVGEGGRAVADLAATADAKLVDGAVVGTAVAVRAGGTRLRSIQTGYVRNYALAVGAGAVGVLAFVVSRS